jgi:hypothetical protein
MYLRSRALIITLEGCISSALPGQNESTLQQLLATFLPTGDASAAGLASAIVRLGDLLADDAPDTVGAAQRAVSSVVASLKSGSSGASSKDASAVSGWVARVSDITKEIGRQQSFLQKLAQTSGGIITKEQTACAVKIVRLQAQKFDLLQPGSLPKAGAANSSNPTLKSLSELKGVISAHMKVRRCCCCGGCCGCCCALALLNTHTWGAAAAHMRPWPLAEPRPPPPPPQEAQAAESHGSSKAGNSSASAFKREEAILAQQAADLGSQIKTLEAQLAALRAQQQEVRARPVRGLCAHASPRIPPRWRPRARAERPRPRPPRRAGGRPPQPDPAAPARHL